MKFRGPTFTTTRPEIAVEEQLRLCSIRSCGQPTRGGLPAWYWPKVKMPLTNRTLCDEMLHTSSNSAPNVSLLKSSSVSFVIHLLCIGYIIIFTNMQIHTGHTIFVHVCKSWNSQYSTLKMEAISPPKLWLTNRVHGIGSISQKIEFFIHVWTQ
jgi:hypothetical protein